MKNLLAHLGCLLCIACLQGCAVAQLGYMAAKAPKGTHFDYETGSYQKDDVVGVSEHHEKTKAEQAADQKDLEEWRSVHGTHPNVPTK